MGRFKSELTSVCVEGDGAPAVGEQLAEHAVALEDGAFPVRGRTHTDLESSRHQGDGVQEGEIETSDTFERIAQLAVGERVEGDAFLGDDGPAAVFGVVFVFVVLAFTP